jgi:hypothetical protein
LPLLSGMAKLGAAAGASHDRQGGPPPNDGGSGTGVVVEMGPVSGRHSSGASSGGAVTHANPLMRSPEASQGHSGRPGGASLDDLPGAFSAPGPAPLPGHRLPGEVPDAKAAVGRAMQGAPPPVAPLSRPSPVGTGSRGPSRAPVTSSQRILRDSLLFSRGPSSSPGASGAPHAVSGRAADPAGAGAGEGSAAAETGEPATPSGPSSSGRGHKGRSPVPGSREEDVYAMDNPVHRRSPPTAV